MTDSTLADEIAQYPWYHTLDLGNGVVTPGMFDHRPVVDRYRMPVDLSGLRCLDVGTMDGFWAFEMERRGASEVVALDIEDPEKLDWPPAIRAKTVPTMDETKGRRFKLVQDALGSNVQRVLRSVYELDVDLGQFDLVFCGDVICHLKDPISALQRILSVCRGSAIIVTPIVRFKRSKRPLVEFDGIDQFQWWAISEPALERMMYAVGFARVEMSPTFELPTAVVCDWKGLRGIARGYVSP